MRVRYNLEGARFFELTILHDTLLAEKYRDMSMNKLFVITDETGTFRVAINPQKIVSIEVVPG